MLNTWVLVGFIALTLITVSGIIIHIILIARIKKMHPDAWKIMGSPSIYWVSRKESLLKTEFFKEKKHKKLNDNVVLILSKCETVLNYIQKVLFFVFFISLIILIIRN